MSNHASRSELMSIREAMLKAADQIEQHPETFDFYSSNIPGCGTPGCALGWTAAFRFGLSEGVDFFSGFDSLGRAVGFDNGSDFYDQMNDIAGSSDWTDEATLCASVMRQYADKYHPAQP